jgi:hypothetical protein
MPRGSNWFHELEKLLTSPSSSDGIGIAERAKRAQYTMRAIAAPSVKCNPGLFNQAEIAQAIAKERGEHSAAAHAVKEFILRRANGESVIVLAARGRWLVGTESEVHAQQLAIDEERARRRKAAEQPRLRAAPPT